MQIIVNYYNVLLLLIKLERLLTTEQMPAPTPPQMARRFFSGRRVRAPGVSVRRALDPLRASNPLDRCSAAKLGSIPSRADKRLEHRDCRRFWPVHLPAPVHSADTQVAVPPHAARTPIPPPRRRVPEAMRGL